MKRSLILGLAAGAALLGANAAHAGNVQWSIGINLPPVGTVISSGPSYYQEPVYYQAPTYYDQAPRYYAPPPVVYRAPPVVYRPPVVVYRDTRPYYGAPVYVGRGARETRWVPPGHRWDGRDNDRWQRGGHDHDRRDNDRGHRGRHD